MLGMFSSVLWQWCLINTVYSVSHHPILVVVSYDAFRYDYFETKTVPNMNRLRKAGTYADHLNNTFPTKTFPNHHTIATGLYPETHGVIGNTYFNSSTGSVTEIGYEMFHFNEAVAPIWRRNEDQGGYSGVMMWPGGCYPYQGKQVTYCHNYDPSYDWFQRIDKVMSWIKDPGKPANLVMVYIEEPDTHGHMLGTDSDLVNNLINKLDNLTLYLEQQLKLHKLNDRVNVIHLSDHGMINVQPPNFINVTQYLTRNTFDYAGSTPVLQFVPRKGHEREVYQKLKNASRLNGHFKIYTKEEYPERWHYKNNPRSPPILVVSDSGYGLDDLIEYVTKYAEKLQLNVTDESKFGVHGYDYTMEEMRPFFMARGPKIKVNHKVPPFNTVDLYNLFCKILEITPGDNNGTLVNIVDVMRSDNNGKYSLSSLLIIAAGGIFICIILFGCAAIMTLMMIKRQQSITTTAALNKRFPQTFQSSVESQHLLEAEEA